jgi:GNAT superfamily N-acetyltransferase
MLVRSARTDDEAEILRIFAAAGRAAWAHIMSPEALDAHDRWREMPWGLAEILVAEDGGTVVGFARIEPGTCELHLLYTHPTVWGKGAGRLLMDEALALLHEHGCTQAFLWTEERNERPRRVYERYGWTLNGDRREREVDGCDLAELRYCIDLASVDAHRDRADIA